MMEADAKIEIIAEDLGGAEEKGDPEAETGTTPGTGSEERMHHYCREPGYFWWSVRKKKRDQAKQGEQKSNATDSWSARKELVRF